jgi:hypothetical protein
MIAPHTSELISYGIGAVCVSAALVALVASAVSPRFRRWQDRQEARGARRRVGGE